MPRLKIESLGLNVILQFVQMQTVDDVDNFSSRINWWQWGHLKYKAQYLEESGSFLLIASDVACVDLS